VHVHLHERRIADALGPVNLASLDDQDVARAGLELLIWMAVDGWRCAPIESGIVFIAMIGLPAAPRP
jgi:hypothetical protein